MIEEIPVVTKLRPAGGRMLRVRFAGDPRDYQIDLTGFLAQGKHFAPLLEDAATFAKAVIVEDGIGIAWPLKTRCGDLDISASTLRRIAEEQLRMTGAD